MAKTGPETIEVLVPIDDPDDSVIIDALNFEGSACSLATAAFEKALGMVKKKSLKPEYTKKVVAKRNIHLGSGK